MASQLQQQNTFSAGELSPKLYERSGLEVYSQGAAKIENLMVLPQGGITRRPSTHYVTTLTGHFRIFPFVFGGDDALVFAFGEKRLRFFINGKALRGYTSQGVQWSTFNFDDTDTTSHVYELKTPYSWEDVKTLTLAQLGDVVYVASKTHPMYKMLRVAARTDPQAYQWQMGPVQFVDGPYKEINPNVRHRVQVRQVTPEIYLPLPVSTTPADTSPPVPPLFSSLIFQGWKVNSSELNTQMLLLSGFGLFDNLEGDPLVAHHFLVPTRPTHALHSILMRVELSGTWHWFRLVYKTSSFGTSWRIVQGGKEAIPFFSLTPEWRLGALHGIHGRPALVAFFQQRLCLSGVRRYPLTVWQSVVGDFECFSPSLPNGVVQDIHAKNYTLAASRIGHTLWMRAHLDSLFIGVEHAVYQIKPEPPIAANEISVPTVNQVSHLPCEAVEPVTTGQSLFFVQGGGRQVRVLQQGPQGQVGEARDATILAEHLFQDTKITSMAWAERPYSALFCVLENGVLLNMAYSANERTLAWSRHTLGGDGKVEDLCIIPIKNNDQVWLIVRRGEGDQARRTLEYFDPDTSFHADSLTQRAAVNGVVSGLERFNQQTVVVLANGSELGCTQVANGQLTFAPPYTGNVWVGLPITSEVQTLPLSRTQAKGLLQRVHHANLLINNAKGSIAYGTNPQQLDQINLADTAIFNGKKRLALRGGHAAGAQVTLRLTGTKPFTLLGLGLEYSAHG